LRWRWVREWEGIVVVEWWVEWYSTSAQIHVSTQYRIYHPKSFTVLCCARASGSH